MSQEVDQRVVEMRFDNAKFEKNVRQSIDSLNALNRSLRFDGAEKGFETVQKASDKVDFNRMQGGLETLCSKFSALEVIGTTALVKITSKAMDAGEKLVKSLSIDQVTSGWNKYAQKTASVQTIMNATGKSINKVNQYLEKLMWFSDETSYGFTDMTSALSTLTAAGGDIEKMIPMIMGMANATAYAGKGAAEFQRVVYNLAQSYGTGAIQLIDWKSVEQAGAGSQQLKQMLIDTAVDLGKIKEGDVTTGTFDSTLQKKWADREVMETAFGKYAEFAEAVKAELDANPDKYHNQASLAIEAIADQYDEVTVKAFKAAQEAKSFSEAVDATKDAVSSGWMETFDILFGNYEEAKTFWSGLAEEFWNIFAGGQDGRNNWLKKAFDSGLDQLVDDTALSDVSDAFRNQLQRSLIASGKLTEQGIEDAGSFTKALQDAGVTADDLYEQVQYSLAGYEEAAKMSDKELAAQGVSRKTLEKTIEAYQKMADAIQNGEVNLDSYAAKMGQMSGREHFFNGILNILEGINNVLSPIREGFDAVFHTDGGPLYAMLEGFDNLTSKLVLSEGTVEKLSKVFEGFFSVLSVGFKVIKTAGRIAIAVLGKLLDALSPLGDAILSVGAAFGDVFTELNESLNSAESAEDVIDALATAFGKLLQPVKDVWNAIRTLVHGGSLEEAKSQMGSFSGIVGAVSKVFENFGLKGVSISNILGTAVQVLGGIFELAFGGIGSLIEKAFGGLSGAGKVIEDFKSENLPTLEAVGDTMKSLPEKVGAAMKDFGSSVQTAFYNVANACKAGLAAVKEFFNLKDVDIYRLLALVDVGLLALAIWGVASALKGMQKAVKGVADEAAKLLSNPVTDLLKSMKNAVDTWTKQNTANNFVNIAKGIGIAIGTISASMYLLSKIEDPKQAVQALGSVMVMLLGLVASMKWLAKSDVSGLDSVKLLGTMVSVSIGIGTMTAAMMKIGSLHTYQVANGIAAIEKIMSALVGMVGMLTVFNTYGEGARGAAGFVAVAAAVDVVALALIPLAQAAQSGLDINGAASVIEKVSAGLALLVAAGALFEKFGPKLGEKFAAKAVDKLSNNISEAVSALQKTVSKVIALAGVATALLIAGHAITVIASAGENIKAATIAALATIGGIAAIATAMAAIPVKSKKMLEQAAAITLMATALTIVAKAVDLMSKALQNQNSSEAMADLSIMMLAMIGVVYALGKVNGEALKAAGSAALIASALLILAGAIDAIDVVGADRSVQALVVIVGSIGALALALALFPKLDKAMGDIVSAALKLSIAVGILAPAVMLLGQLKITQAIAAVIALIGIVASLSAASLLFGAVKPMAAGLKVLASAILTLSKAFSVLAGGLLKLSLAAGILAVLAAFAEPICQTIHEAAPSIQQALIDIVTVICNVIIACAEPLGLALETVIETLIQVIIDVIGWAWDGGGNGDGIQGALDGLWDNLTNWFATHDLVQLFKDWAMGAGHALADIHLFGSKEEMESMYTDERSLPVKAADALTAIMHKFDQLFGTHLKKDVLTAWGDAYAPKDASNTTKQTTDATKQAASASGTAASNMEKTAAAMQTTAKTAGEAADGMVQISTDTGKVYTMTAEQAKALMTGKAAADDMAGATTDLGTAAGTTNGALARTATAMLLNAGTAAGSTDVVDEAGKALDGKEQQLVDDTATTVQNGLEATKEVAETAGDEAGGGFVDHFKSAVSSGLFGKLTCDSSGATKLVKSTGDKISGVVHAEDWLPGSTQNKTITAPTTQNDNGKSWLDKTKEKIGSEIDKKREDLNTLLGDIADPITNPTGTNPTGSGKNKSKSSSGSSGKQKTVAEQIEEAYKTKLAANKTLKETVDQEYELWQAENQYSASNEELTAKKAEHAAAEISAQAARVELAQQKYDDLVSKWGADKEETKEAYNDLLTEKTSLAEMKAKQYTDIFEDVAKRYDTNIDTMEKEYKLCAAQNDKSATSIDKIDRETQSDIDKLAIRQKKEALAKEQYETLLAQGLAEDNDLVISAYNDWLDAQTETQELLNEIADKQLERIEAEIDLIATAQKLSSSRMDILQKVYDDGDLSERANAYKEAVETYGEDSDEARKAKFQGTTSSILAAVDAMKNLNYQMQQTEQYQKLLDDGYYTDANGKQHNLSQDEINDYTEKLLDSKSAFLGFAENLADAFDMSDSGKSAMLKLANAVQKNWKPLKQGFDSAMDKAFANNPELKDKFVNAFGEAFSDAGIEIGTEVISTITSLMQGDWANALASGISLMLDIAFNTKIGKEAMENGVNLFAEGFNQISGAVMKALGSEGMAGAVESATGQMTEAVAGNGGLTTVLASLGEGLGQIGGAVAGFVSEFWPYILAAVAIIGALVGIATLVNKHKDEAAQTAEEAGIDYPTEYEKGIREASPNVEKAVKDMTDTANDIALAAAQSIADAMDTDADYEPTITPVVDLTNVVDSAEELNSTFASEKAVNLDSTVTRRIASEVDQSPAIQNGVHSQSDANLLNAIAGLGDRMDAVGQSIKGMKVVMDGRKTVGYIDTQLGLREARSH